MAASVDALALSTRRGRSASAYSPIREDRTAGLPWRHGGRRSNTSRLPPQVPPLPATNGGARNADSLARRDRRVPLTRGRRGQRVGLFEEAVIAAVRSRQARVAVVGPDRVQQRLLVGKHPAGAGFLDDRSSRGANGSPRAPSSVAGDRSMVEIVPAQRPSAETHTGSVPIGVPRKPPRLSTCTYEPAGTGLLPVRLPATSSP